MTDFYYLVMLNGRGKQLFFTDGYGLDGIPPKTGILGWVTQGDTVYNIHSAGDLAKYCIIAFREGSRTKCDEELAAIGISTRICHGDHPGFIKVQIIAFVYKLIARSATACPCRITALGHKSCQYPVEGQAIKESLVRKKNKTVHGDRCLIGIKLNDKLTAFCHLNCGEILFRCIN